LHNSCTISGNFVLLFSFNTFASNFIVNIDMETNKKMKKVNPKIVALAIMILSFVAAGGIAAKNAIGPSGFGQGDEGGDGGGG
jgi:hypothetical protein